MRMRFAPVPALLLLAAAALAGDPPAPKWPLLAEALPESEDRNVLLLVVLRKGDDVGGLPALASPRALYHVVGTRPVVSSLDVADEAERKAATERFGADLVAKAPILLLVVPAKDATPFPLAGATDEKLKAAVAAEEAKVGDELVGSADYWNSWHSFVAGKEALARGDKPRARSELHSALWVQGFSRVKKKCRFVPEAQKLYDELMADGRARLADARKAHGAKDWKKLWELALPLAQEYRGTDVAESLKELLEPLAKNKDSLRAFQEILVETVKPATEKHRAAMDAVREEALAALRAKVPASEVKDEDVTVVYWEATTEERGKKSALRVGGFWLGADRVVTLVWDTNAKKLVQPEPSASNEPASTADLRAKDDAERAALDLVRRFARHEGRLVAAAELKKLEDGTYSVLYYDGWDGGCGHLSFGWAIVDPAEKVVTMAGHVM